MAYLLNVILGTIVPMCVTALVTIAITIIFKTSSTTNFAQGVISAFGAYVVAAALNKLNLSLWLALPIGAVVATSTPWVSRSSPWVLSPSWWVPSP